MDEQNTNSTAVYTAQPSEEPSPATEESEPLAEAPEHPPDPPEYSAETTDQTAKVPEQGAEAPELPQKTNDILSLPEVSYTDTGNDAEVVTDDPEMQEKLKNIDDHMRWNIWICFFSCGLIALFSNYFAFCWLISLVGIYKAHKCQEAKKKGLIERARLYSCEARLWFYLSFMVGVGAGLAMVVKYYHTNYKQLPTSTRPEETEDVDYRDSNADYLY